MHIALTIWKGQVATVADFARHLLLVEVEDGVVRQRCEIDAPGDDALHWCDRLTAEGVTTLFCGAITRHLDDRIKAAGITVVDGCTGSADNVLTAWLAGTIDELRWHAPGGRRWQEVVLDANNANACTHSSNHVYPDH